MRSNGSAQQPSQMLDTATGIRAWLSQRDARRSGAEEPLGGRNEFGVGEIAV
jgi:hypothetical protein